MDHGGNQETTQQIRAILRQGNSIEVTGYELSAQLANELDSKSLQNLKNLSGTEIHWFDWVFDETAQLPPVSQKLILDWQRQDINPVIHPFTGASFWQAHERELTPALINITTSLFA